MGKEKNVFSFPLFSLSRVEIEVKRHTSVSNCLTHAGKLEGQIAFIWIMGDADMSAPWKV